MACVRAAGLKLVCDDLGISIDSRDSEHCETLMDVQSACRTAVEILNDLLCFDELDSGTLEIHKQDVLAIPFIVDCVGMFASQAREFGVTVSVVTSGINQIPLADAGNPSLALTTGLYEGDTVSIDKFKMDQALRNLISNALKFTPRGGSVTVCASFVPEKADETPTPDPYTPVPIKDHFSFMEFFGRPDLNINLPFHPHPRPWKQKIHAAANRETPDGIQNQIPAQVMDAEQQYRRDLECGNDPPNDPTSHLNSTSSARRVPSQLSSSFQSSSESSQVPMYASGRSKARDLSLNFSSDSSITTTRQQILRRVKPAASLNRTRVPGPSGMRNTGGVISTGKLRISVSDTGAGITEEDQRRLFKGTVQFNPDVVQGGGSGLGLWITSSIVHMHAGTIKVQSGGIGKGSTFTLEVDMQRWVPHHRSLSPSRITCPLLRASVGPIPTAKRSCSDQKYMARSSEERERDKDRDKERDKSSHGVPSEYSSVFVGLEGRDLQALSLYSEFDRLEVPDVRPAGPSLVGVSRVRRDPMRTGDDISTISDKSRSHIQNQNAGELLIVEDSSLNRKMLCKLLRSSGYSCEEACDGLGAVEKVKARMARSFSEKRTFDAILMDFVMPNVDGPTATDVIRGLGYKGPVFGLTGNTSGSDVNHFKRCGADAVLTKPFDILVFKHLMALESEDHNPSISCPETENVNEDLFIT
jgi:signal transduction histidine kinase/CheY-like chemotaxis protein